MHLVNPTLIPLDVVQAHFQKTARTYQTGEYAFEVSSSDVPGVEGFNYNAPAIKSLRATFFQKLFRIFYDSVEDHSPRDETVVHCEQLQNNPIPDWTFSSAAVLPLPDFVAIRGSRCPWDPSYVRASQCFVGACGFAVRGGDGGGVSAGDDVGGDPAVDRSGAVRVGQRVRVRVADLRRGERGRLHPAERASVGAAERAGSGTGAAAFPWGVFGRGWARRLTSRSASGK